jgi:hypothetical protein
MTSNINHCYGIYEAACFAQFFVLYPFAAKSSQILQPLLRLRVRLKWTVGDFRALDVGVVDGVREDAVRFERCRFSEARRFSIDPCVPFPLPSYMNDERFARLPTISRIFGVLYREPVIDCRSRLFSFDNYSILSAISFLLPLTDRIISIRSLRRFMELPRLSISGMITDYRNLTLGLRVFFRDFTEFVRVAAFLCRLRPGDRGTAAFLGRSEGRRFRLSSNIECPRSLENVIGCV